LTGSEVDQLLHAMHQVQRLQLTRVLIRGCNIGQSEESMTVLCNFLGARILDAPQVTTLFVRSDPMWGCTLCSAEGVAGHALCVGRMNCATAVAAGGLSKQGDFACRSNISVLLAMTARQSRTPGKRWGMDSGSFWIATTQVGCDLPRPFLVYGSAGFSPGTELLPAYESRPGL
jgi:hypothetical protein